MFSIPGDLSRLIFVIFRGIPLKIVEELGFALNGAVVFFCGEQNSSYNSPQQTIASVRSSTGPHGGWLAVLRSYLCPTPLARVRVFSRRSFR